MRLLPAGTTGLLVELSGLDEVLALLARLEDTRPPHVIDLVPAERTLLVRFDPGVAHSGDVVRWVRTASSNAARPGQRSPQASLEIVVHYDGEDLDDVARITGLSADEVVAAHVGTPWRVAFTGFAPGFGYLVGGDERLRAVTRRDTPRTRVPAGAVALAGGYSGVYPRSSPGGWQLLGHTPTRVWDTERDPPALLRPGVTVRFRAA